MDLKSGYKQSEVGMIPEVWDAGGLGRFWNVTDCKHVTAEFVADGFPVASIKEVQSRFIDLTNAKQTTSHFYSLLIEGGRKPCAGDLILSRNATVGEVAQVAEWHPPFAMGQDVCLLRKKLPEHSTEFLHAVFQSPVIANQLSNLMVGSTFKRVNVEQIRNFSVPMPPPPEQRAIAGALSDVDELIGALDQLIAKKRDLKQGAMQELLTGKKRLPGFEEKPGHKQTEEGVIQEDWNQNTIRDIATKVGSGVTPTGGSKRYKEFGRPFVRSQNVGWGNLLLDDLAFIDEETHNGFPATELKRHDVLLNITGASIGRTALADDRLVGGNVNQHVCIIRLDASKTIPKFINLFLLSALGQRQIDSFQAGGNRQGLNFSQINSLQVLLPPTKVEQEAIATILSDMDAEISILEQRRDKTRDLKKGMMQELLTGRTRLV